MGLVQGVEGVEELLLNALLAGEELHVVYQQYIGLPVFAAEADQLVVLNGVNVFVGELLGGKIGDAGDFLVGGDVLADGVKQMGLSQAHSAVEEQGVVGFAGSLGHRHGGGMGMIVVFTHHKGFKRVLGIEGGFASRHDGPFGGFDDGPGPGFGDAHRTGCRRRSVADAEFYFQNLAGNMGQDFGNEALVVVLEPDFAEIVGDFQDKGVFLQTHRFDRQEPEIINVRVQHRA